MAKRDPNKFEVKGNPSIFVTIARHSRDGDHAKDACWHFVFWHDGKRKRGSTGKTEHADAVEVARKEAEKVMNAAVNPSGGLDLGATVAQYLEARWPKDRKPDVRKGNRSYQDAKSRLELFVEYTGKDARLSSLDLEGAKGLFRKFLKKRKADGMSARTVLNDKLILSRFCSELLEADPAVVYWPANPLSFVKSDKPDAPDAVPLTEEDVQAVLSKGKTSAAWPLIVLCLGMGFAAAGSHACAVEARELQGQCRYRLREEARPDAANVHVAGRPAPSDQNRLTGRLTAGLPLPPQQLHRLRLLRRGTKSRIRRRWRACNAAIPSPDGLQEGGAHNDRARLCRVFRPRACSCPEALSGVWSRRVGREG